MSGYYVKENGEVAWLTEEEAADPFRQTRTTYAEREDAELVAQIGEEAAAHVRSQKKLGMDDVEYGHFVMGGVKTVPMEDEEARDWAKKLKGEK